MACKLLRNNQWNKLQDLLPGKAPDCGATTADNRQFLEAVLWVMRTGARWRDLPDEYDRWQTSYLRFLRLAEKGIWQRIAEALATDPNFEWGPSIGRLSLPISMRLTQKGVGTPSLRTITGGFSTKIHTLVDVLGNPVRFLLTGGQEADVTPEPVLLAEISGIGAVLGDKAYDAQAVLKAIDQCGAEAVIPPKVSRLIQRSYDKYLYRARAAIECFFHRLKQFRRLATCYEK